VSDFNGRIGAILRAAAKEPTEARMLIRQILRDEHRDGWQEGHSDGMEDAYQGSKAKRAAEEAVREYEWTGTDKRGENSRGGFRFSPQSVAAIVRDRHEQGWRQLTVTLDGHEVAGICGDEENPGEANWWANASALKGEFEED
jgi:hypothetical protein